jgi:hypothetical protein
MLHGSPYLLAQMKFPSWNWHNKKDSIMITNANIFTGHFKTRF